MDKVIKKYLRNCKNIFPFYRKNERNFFENFKQSISCYTTGHKEVEYNDLIERIGAPKEIMVSYIQDCDEEYIIKQMNLKRTFKNFLLALV